MKHAYLGYLLSLFLLSCSKGDNNSSVTPPPGSRSFSSIGSQVNGISHAPTYSGISTNPVIKLFFGAPLDRNTVTKSIGFKDPAGTSIAFNTSFENKDSGIVLQPTSPLAPITRYAISVATTLQATGGGTLKTADSIYLSTAIDSTDKFPTLSDSALLTLVQQQTFNYFWDFGHPISGMARERVSSLDMVTVGGSGFGVMAILVGIQRNFITRTQGLSRIQTIVNFLCTKAQRYHGAFPHWMSGTTGATLPFSTQDDGADLVETAYMLQGLLTARQFFNSPTDPIETAVRDSINSISDNIQWSWFRQNGQNTLFWHWSPNYGWSTNQQVNGWNEALIVYILAASAKDSISKTVYDNGWARNGGIRNGGSYFNTVLPLGPPSGGPLFFAHYSFLGLDPNGLSDAYASYWNQNTAHSGINNKYCVQNPLGYYGYSGQCWGLSASDEQNGYSAHSPTNDNGVIAPTAAISSLPYTPVESMNALRFFYYKLGNKIWGTYGFTDAFNLSTPWFDTDFLAIDQGPQIIMIENYRSKLLWTLFMSCPEIKQGLKRLGFSSPYLNR